MRRQTTLCRREFFRTAGLAGLGLGLRPAASPAAAPARHIRSCVLVFFYGGPSQLDTLDPKPDAPAEVRGEYRTIATAVPGVRLCEHLPHTARLLGRLALVRSRERPRAFPTGSTSQTLTAP